MSRHVIPLPARIREARKAHGWKQYELAKLARFKPTAISHFETGSRSPSMANLVKLCKALDVSAGYLLGLEQRQNSDAVLAEYIAGNRIHNEP